MGNSDKAWVVIPAAGVGKRMQSSRPKQYLLLHGKTVIEHTIACFTRRTDIAGVVVALHPNDPYWPLIQLDSTIPVHVVKGGEERAHSVFNALENLRNVLQVADDCRIMVHDAARPCLQQQDIDALLEASRNAASGAILAMPVRDTMKRERNRESRDTATIGFTEPREGLWHALTPQLFRLGQLHDALANALQHNLQITDEASALENAGQHPLLVEGQASNIKITRPTDLALAEFFLTER